MGAEYVIVFRNQVRTHARVEAGVDGRVEAKAAAHSP
jgi:hypothetical protein